MKDTYKSSEQALKEFRGKVEQMPEPYRSRGMVHVKEVETLFEQRKKEWELQQRKSLQRT